MGKLHSLRRAIQRDPDKWRNARAAARYGRGDWFPITRWSYGDGAYRKFIAKCLASLLK